LEKRTSGAKALITVAFCGTAEAVPFVQYEAGRFVQCGSRALRFSVEAGRFVSVWKPGASFSVKPDPSFLRVKPAHRSGVKADASFSVKPGRFVQ
jgi:hypothetical protein